MSQYGKCQLCWNRPIRGQRFCAEHVNVKQPPKVQTWNKPRPNGKPPEKPWHWVYRTARWRKLRTALLTNGFCAACGCNGHSIFAEVVDHIVPLSWLHRMDCLSYGAFSLTNLQPLCKRHHSHKTTQERTRRIYDYNRERLLILEPGASTELMNERFDYYLGGTDHA